MATRLTRFASIAFGPHLNLCRLQNRIVLCNSAAFMSVVLGCSCLSRDTKLRENSEQNSAENTKSADTSSNGYSPDINKRSLEMEPLVAVTANSRIPPWNLTQTQVLNRLRQLRGQASAEATRRTSCSATQIVHEALTNDTKHVTARIGSSLEETVDEQSPIIYPIFQLPNQLRSLVVAPEVLV